MAAVDWSGQVTAACASSEQARFAVFGGIHSEKSIARFLCIFSLDELPQLLNAGLLHSISRLPRRGNAYAELPLIRYKAEGAGKFPF
jgi:lipopolysaccharide/colanic/teichoic acid biosynthesis glycosyltransferase